MKEVVYTIPMVVFKQTEQCMVCGSELEYLQQSKCRVCTFCEKKEEGHIACPHGHFICDTCHGVDARKMIENTVFSALDADPLAIAEHMLSHPSLPMLGCEHAFIASGALMAALKNSPYGKGKITDEHIQEAFARTMKQAVGGYCGLTGVCGITPAIGSCFSLFLGARCGTDSEQKITMDAAIRVSQAISAVTGPSCCKAYVRAALMESVAMLSERLGVVLPVKKSTVVCRHSGKHPHGCREEKCPYYARPVKDIFADAKFIPGTISTC
jgi:Family of unknown function (DUF5714)